MQIAMVHTFQRIERRYTGRLLRSGMGAGLALILSTTTLPSRSQTAEQGQSPERHTLSELFIEAQQNSPLIASQIYAKQAGDEGVRSAWQQFLPTASASSAGIDNRSATIYSVTQPLWTGGRLSAGLDMSEARQKKAALAVDDARVALALQMISIYQSLLSSCGRRDALIRNVERLQQFENMIERRIGQGASARADHDLVRARQLQAQSELLASEGSVQSVLAQFSELLGRPVKEDELIWQPGPTTPQQALSGDAAQSGGDIPAGADDPQPVLDAAQQWFPALAMAEQDVAMAEADLRVVRSALSPSVSLQYQHQLGYYPGALDSGDRLMATLTVTPGAGLSLASDMAMAQRKVDAAKEAVLAQRRDLNLRVLSGWKELKTTLGRLEYLALARQTSRNVLDSSARLFVAGQRSWLDLLNSVRELTGNEQQESDAKAYAISLSDQLAVYSGSFIGRRH